MTTMRPTCAIVVTYHPPAGLSRRLAALRATVPILIVDNGSGEAARGEIESVGAARVLVNESNRGLAAALNQGVRLAREMGFEEVILLDQDSEPFSEMAAVLQAARERFESPSTVGVVGSNLIEETGRPLYEAKGGETSRVVPFVITSGSLLSIDVFDKVGPFREDLFIDFVDIEWCWRLANQGLRSLLCLTPTMRHVWGAPTRHRILGVPVTVYNHSPVRRYFIVRNGVYLHLRWFGRSPVRSLAGLARMPIHMAVVLLLEEKRLQKAAAMLTGLFHGVIGRLGPASDWLTRTARGDTP